MHIMTKDGWVALTPREYSLPGHTPTLLERMGITMKYNGAKAMADYANSDKIGCYFTYYADGTAKQTKGALNPLPGMYGEDRND